jgi:hypothetical protein
MSQRKYNQLWQTCSEQNLLVGQKDLTCKASITDANQQLGLIMDKWR